MSVLGGRGRGITHDFTLREGLINSQELKHTFPAGSLHSNLLFLTACCLMLLNPFKSCSHLSLITHVVSCLLPASEAQSGTWLWAVVVPHHQLLSHLASEICCDTHWISSAAPSVLADFPAFFSDPITDFALKREQREIFLSGFPLFDHTQRPGGISLKAFPLSAALHKVLFFFLYWFPDRVRPQSVVLAPWKRMQVVSWSYPPGLDDKVLLFRPTSFPNLL